jgi:hypothetical protein
VNVSRRPIPGSAGAVAVSLVVNVAVACGRSPSGYEGATGVGACDPSTTTFTTEIDNPFFPFTEGRQVELRSDDGVLVRVTALDEIENVAGVETRVIEEHEETRGRVAEISRNFFAQNADGDVCYFGEEVDMFGDDGSVTSHSGSWRANGDDVRPGMFMPADPHVGQAFQQEMAPGVAEDQSKVVALGETVEVPAGTFDDTVRMTDLNPLDGTEDEKVYAREIGLIVDETAQLTAFTPRG